MMVKDNLTHIHQVDSSIIIVWIGLFFKARYLVSFDITIFNRKACI